MRILVFDPGESTGWVFAEGGEAVDGGTAGKDHREVVAQIERLRPDVVVYERFNLYPGMAQSMAWNSFYPCEVIGAIRLVCSLKGIELVGQAPGVKKYSGLRDKRTSKEWEALKSRVPSVTEHTWDALQHLHYYLRNRPAPRA